MDCVNKHVDYVFGIMLSSKMTTVVVCGGVTCNNISGQANLRMWWSRMESNMCGAHLLTDQLVHL